MQPSMIKSGMTLPNIVYVYFLYGLAFFTMGLIVALEGGRASDARLRQALRPLAAFGVVHGTNEWLEMFSVIGYCPVIPPTRTCGPGCGWPSWRFRSCRSPPLALRCWRPHRATRRLSLLVPLAQVAIWGIGLLIMRPGLVCSRLNCGTPRRPGRAMCWPSRLAAGGGWPGRPSSTFSGARACTASAAIACGRRWFSPGMAWWARFLPAQHLSTVQYYQ